jgi:hypothetical protein
MLTAAIAAPKISFAIFAMIWPVCLQVNKTMTLLSTRKRSDFLPQIPAR